MEKAAESGQKTMPYIKSLSKDTLLYIPYRLIPVIFGFISLSIYTRIFTPQDYGDYSLILVTTELLGIFVYSWINESNLRFFSRYKADGRLNDLFSTSFLIIFALQLILTLSLAALFYLSLLPGVISQYVAMVIGVFIAISIFEPLLGILRSDRRVKEVSFYRCISTGAIFFISLLLIFVFKMGISAILLGSIITNLAISAVIFFKLGFWDHVRVKYFSRSTMRDYVDYGIPLIATALSSWILYLSDRYILLYYKGSSEVGIYSASYQLGGYPISLFTSILTMAAFPLIVETWEHSGENATKHLISTIFKYYLLITVPVLVGVTILSGDLIYILGASYASGTIILPWICMGEFLWGVCFYMNNGLQLKKKTRLLAYMLGIVAISNIILNVLLVPSYGFFGSGVSYAISYFIYLTISLAISREYLRWGIPEGLIFNVLLGCTIMGGFLLLVKSQIPVDLPGVIALICIAAGIYFFIIYARGELREELSLIKNIRLH